MNVKVVGLDISSIGESSWAVFAGKLPYFLVGQDKKRR